MEGTSEDGIGLRAEADVATIHPRVVLNRASATADEETAADEEDARERTYTFIVDPKANDALQMEADYAALHAGDGETDTCNNVPTSISAGPTNATNDTTLSAGVSASAGASAAMNSETVCAVSRSDDEEDAGAAGGLSFEAIEELAALRLRALEQDYETTRAADASQSPAQAAAAAYAASLAASGVASDGGGSTPEESKARKLAELRARLAASRAARSGGGVGSGEQPTMTLAPGATDFPEDYDALQALDQAAVLAEARDATPHARGSYASEAARVTSVGALADTAATAVFDPFGAAAGASPVPSAPRAGTVRRAVSPIPAETKAAIADVMSRLKLTPRGGVSPFTEKLVEAALARGRAAARGPLPAPTRAPEPAPAPSPPA